LQVGLPVPWRIRHVEISNRLVLTAFGAAEALERLKADLPTAEDDVVLDFPISIYGGG